MPPEEDRSGAPPASLREYLLGTWELESYTVIAEDGSLAAGPFGAEATGLLIYAPDGFMSAFLRPAARRLFASGDVFSPTSDELAEASRIVAYSGRDHIDEVAGTVTHAVALSFFPNWIGQDQVRRIERSPSRLILMPNKPLQSDGKMTWPRLGWVRPFTQ